MELRARYASNPERKRVEVRARYAANPKHKKLIVNKWCMKHQSAILQRRKNTYYASIMHRRAARLLHHGLHRERKEQAVPTAKQANIMIAQRARYVPTAPRLDVKETCVRKVSTQKLV